jgi:hypothetical protein
LIVGNNVLAHVPDINDFVAGLTRLLKPEGVLTMEFPHLLRLMEGNQFDTIYHEHFSYLSLLAVETIFGHHGLRLFDVQQLATHGGSLRIWACHNTAERFETSRSVFQLRDQELAAGLGRLETYSGFEQHMRNTKHKLLELLISLKLKGKSIVAYGAAGKGNTLLNYCGIRTDFIDFTVDKNPYKQNHYLPGSRIPVFGPEKIEAHKPDYLLILPWNLKEEIMEQEAYIRQWGGRFIVPIPEAAIYP